MKTLSDKIVSGVRVEDIKEFINELKVNSGLFCVDMNNHTAFTHLIDRLVGDKLIEGENE